MSEPARPISEAEKAVPMPRSGAARLFFSSSNTSTLSDWRVSSEEIALPTDCMVSSRPQKVPRRPRKTSRPTR